MGGADVGLAGVIGMRGRGVRASRCGLPAGAAGRALLALALLTAALALPAFAADLPPLQPVTLPDPVATPRAVLSLVAGSAEAEPIAPAAPTPAQAEHPARLPVLAANCLSCHPKLGTKSRGGFAPLGGAGLVDLSRLLPVRIEAALRAFRASPRAGTVMPRIARALDDDDIAALAHAFR